jgi:serine/threonine-protein kinase
MGTPQYMSPEQCHGRAVDHRTDIYAMGVILYQMYTGKLPFHGEGFAEILTKQLIEIPNRPSTHVSLPPALDALIMRCLAKDPADRPQSARELGEELAQIVVPRTPPAVSSMPGPRTTTTLGGAAQSAEVVATPRPPARRWPFLVVLLFVGLVSALGAARLAGRRQVTERAGAGPGLPGRDEPRIVATPDALPLAPPREPSVEELVKQPADQPADQPAKQVGGKKSRVPGKPAAHDGARAPGSKRSSGSGLVTDNPFR